MKLTPADEYFGDILEKSLMAREKRDEENFQDEDKLFCLSLCKELKKIPESNRLTAKIGLLDVLQRAEMTSQYCNSH